MIDEYNKSENKKNKNSRKNNMTQFDFIFFDNFFVTRGKQRYSKGPLEIDI